MNSEPRSQSRRVKKHTFAYLLIAVVLLLLIPVLAVVLWQVRGGWRAESRKAAVRARGEPISPEDLESFYVVPKGAQDTTSILLSAFATLDSANFHQDAGELPIVGLSEAEIPPPGTPWPQLAAAEAFLDKYRASLRSLHDAAPYVGFSDDDLRRLGNTS